VAVGSGGGGDRNSIQLIGGDEGEEGACVRDETGGMISSSSSR